MTKYILLLALVFSTRVFAEELNAFEAELRFLEERDEAAFARAEAVTNKEMQNASDMMSDSVSTSNAALKKEETAAENQIESSDIIIKPQTVMKARRIRSR